MPFLMAAFALATACFELLVSKRSTVYPVLPAAHAAPPGTAGVVGRPGVGPGVPPPLGAGWVPVFPGVVALGAAGGAAGGGGAAAPVVVVVVWTGVLSCPPEVSPIAAPAPPPIASTAAAAIAAVVRHLGGLR